MSRTDRMTKDGPSRHRQIPVVGVAHNRASRIQSVGGDDHVHRSWAHWTDPLAAGRPRRTPRGRMRTRNTDSTGSIDFEPVVDLGRPFVRRDRKRSARLGRHRGRPGGGPGRRARFDPPLRLPAESGGQRSCDHGRPRLPGPRGLGNGSGVLGDIPDRRERECRSRGGHANERFLLDRQSDGLVLVDDAGADRDQAGDDGSAPGFTQSRGLPPVSNRAHGRGRRRTGRDGHP